MDAPSTDGSCAPRPSRELELHSVLRDGLGSVQAGRCDHRLAAVGAFELFFSLPPYKPLVGDDSPFWRTRLPSHLPMCFDPPLYGLKLRTGLPPSLVHELADDIDATWPTDSRRDPFITTTIGFPSRFVENEVVPTARRPTGATGGSPCGLVPREAEEERPPTPTPAAPPQPRSPSPAGRCSPGSTSAGTRTGRRAGP